MSRKTTLKYAWLLFSLILLALPVFLLSSPAHFDVIGVCLVIAYILSFPLNILLTGFIYVLVNLFDVTQFGFSIGTLYLMLFAFCVIGYLQWFVLVPRLTKLIRENIFRKDWQINLNGTISRVQTLPEAKLDASVHDWQKNWYDTQKRTPVERLFEKDED
jgi:hypothetical protein